MLKALEFDFEYLLAAMIAFDAKNVHMIDIMTASLF